MVCQKYRGNGWVTKTIYYLARSIFIFHSTWTCKIDKEVNLEQALELAKRPVRVITLGTAGGPQWWREEQAGETVVRFGIATAIVVGEDVYLVDAGYGAGHQLARAGLSFSQVRGIFFTHLHSDHTADLPAFLLFGMFEAFHNPNLPIPVYGPGAVEVPAGCEAAGFGTHVNGIAGMIERLQQANDADLFDRQVFAKRPGIDHFFTPRELDVVAGEEVAEIYTDDNVRVSRAFVDHATMKPAYAFRFDTAAGSITISGDMQPCNSLIALAAGTDILLHEAIDIDWMDRMYPADGSMTEMQQASLIHHQESHSTVAEACRNADRAGATLLVLHHLVPGNTPSAHWAKQASRELGDVRIAEDLDVFELPIRAS